MKLCNQVVINRIYSVLVNTLLSQCFFSLTPEILRNRIAFHVFRGKDERNIGPNWLIGLGAKGLLSAYRNQLGWRLGERVNLDLILTFWQQIFSFIYNIRSVFLVSIVVLV